MRLLRQIPHLRLSNAPPKAAEKRLADNEGDDRYHWIPAWMLLPAEQVLIPDGLDWIQWWQFREISF